MSVKFTTIDENSAGQRLDNFLIKFIKGVPKSHLYRVIRKGEVRVNKGRKKAEYKLKIGDIVRIPPIRVSEQKDNFIPGKFLENILKEVVFEDEFFIAINKPSGIPVHGGSGINFGLIEAFKEKYSPSIELVHRIDRGTSGVVIIAKKRSALKALQELITSRKVKKIYLAMVRDTWQRKTHIIDAPLLTGQKNTVVHSNGKEAVSHFKPIKNFDGLYPSSLVEVEIETGRTHQIRAHAQYANHPLLGDGKYGDFELNKKLEKVGLKRIFLHAKVMEFTHPMTGENLRIEAPLSSELESFMEAL